MKTILIVIALAAVGYFGWNMAQDRGWVAAGKSVAGRLEGQKDREFNKVAPAEGEEAAPPAEE